MQKEKVVINGKREKHVITIQLDDNLDLRGTDELLRELMQLQDAGNYDIVIDLGKVGFISSSGLGALVATLQNLKKHNGTLKLFDLQANVMEKFMITKLIAEFEIYGNKPEALRSYQNK